MAIIFEFDKATSKVLSATESGQEFDYQGKEFIAFGDYNHTLQEIEDARILLKTVSLKYIFANANGVREMDQAEKDQVDADEKAAQDLAEKEAAKDTLFDRHFDALIEVFNNELNILREKLGLQTMTKDEVLVIVQANIDAKP